MGDRFNILSQMEHLQSKYQGTGHADSTKFEWAAHQHRDTFASLMGHQVTLIVVVVKKNQSGPAMAKRSHFHSTEILHLNATLSQRRTGHLDNVFNSLYLNIIYNLLGPD